MTICVDSHYLISRGGTWRQRGARPPLQSPFDIYSWFSLPFDLPFLYLMSFPITLWLIIRFFFSIIHPALSSFFSFRLLSSVSSHDVLSLSLPVVLGFQSFFASQRVCPTSVPPISKKWHLFFLVYTFCIHPFRLSLYRFLAITAHWARNWIDFCFCLFHASFAYCCVIRKEHFLVI